MSCTHKRLIDTLTNFCDQIRPQRHMISLMDLIRATWADDDARVLMDAQRKLAFIPEISLTVTQTLGFGAFGEVKKVLDVMFLPFVLLVTGCPGSVWAPGCCCQDAATRQRSRA